MTPADSTPPGFYKGVGLAAITAGLWGMLPILMDAALTVFHSGTVVWFRFTFAFLFLFIFLAWKNGNATTILKRPPLAGVLSGACLAGNYYLFMEGVRLSSPSNCAVVIQSAPIMLVLIGVLYFKETLNRMQAMGFAIAILGFTLFFAEQGRNAVEVGNYIEADLVITLAALLWALYMALQKRLQDRFSSQDLNLLVYGTAAVFLFLMVDWRDFAAPGAVGWVLIVVLGINTLLAYGCLTEAIKYIPLSLISVIVALNPFLTLMLMQVVPALFPEWVRPETITLMGFTGAAIAIGGVILVIRYHTKPASKVMPEEPPS